MAFSKDEPAPDEGQRPDFEAKLQAFVEICQGIVHRHWEASKYAPELEPKITIDSRGAKYVRLTPVAPGTGAAWAFIDRVTGDVFKPDGFKRPAKGVRGNIYSDAPGEGITAYGPPYAARYSRG